MTRAPSPREACLELAAVHWADEHDVLTRKLQWIGRRNAPDRLFAVNGRAVFIEFKRRGEKPRVTQQREIERLRKACLEAYVVDDFDYFLSIMKGKPS